MLLPAAKQTWLISSLRFFRWKVARYRLHFQFLCLFLRWLLWLMYAISENRGKGFQFGGDSDKSLLGQRGEIILDAVWRISQARTELRTASQNMPGARLRWFDRKSSGCYASIPWGGRAAAVKSLIFWVTITSQRPVIAAANTCRSPASGRVSAGIKVS